MQDDQINKSVDDLMDQDSGATTTAQPTAGFSLGTNPSLPEPPTDQTSPQVPDDSSAQALEEPDQTEEVEASEQVEATDVPSNDSAQVNDDSDELDQIKRDALAQLSPIVSELDQVPEEKYRTLMMLIQASDDQTLIKAAYEAANRIDDKKVRAEALLNIVNEINYFAGQAQKKEEIS